MGRRMLSVLAVLALSLLAASVADGRSSRSNACGARDYSYAGLQSDSKAHGVGATLVPLQTPAVSAGHVGADVYTATLAAALLSILLNAALVRYVPARRAS